MILNRRQMVGGTAATASLAATGLLATPAAAAQLGPVGLQLYTVRDIFEKDPAGTLEKVARVGYKQVEFGGGGYDKMDPAMLRRTMDRVGLTAPSAHIPIEALTGDFDKSIAMARTLGANAIVLPWLGDQYRSPAAWGTLIPTIARIAERVKAAGFTFVYHNHDFEFAMPADGGQTLYDRLIAGTDPALVHFEIDLYWAIKAGQDAKALIRRLAGRIYSYHVKDMRADGSMSAVGAGTVDFAGIFALNRIAGVRYFFVEDDEAPAPYIPDIAQSLATLRRLRFQPVAN